MIDANTSCIPKEMEVNYENISYGMSVEVFDKNYAGYRAGCKVHFFNRKGVLVGNLYEFVPYSRLRLRKNYNGVDRKYIRFFYRKFNDEKKMAYKVKMFLFIPVLKLTSLMIRFTQKYMD